MAIVCFHNENEENGYLSNWYPSTFSINGIGYSSMEQYMMYSKAVCFKDDKVAKQILATEDCAKIKAFGRNVTDRLTIHSTTHICIRKSSRHT